MKALGYVLYVLGLWIGLMWVVGSIWPAEKVDRETPEAAAIRALGECYEKERKLPAGLHLDCSIKE